MLCAGPAALADDAPLKGRAEVNWRYGTERSILMTDFWAPLAQDEDGVLYADVRLMGDDHDNREGNFGIGYRTITTAPVLGKGVVGVNGWFDRRITENDSHFHQITMGAEWRGEALDVLANGYIPLSDERRFTIPNEDPQGAGFSGTGIVVDTDGTAIEEPQAGFDLEIGWELGQSIGMIREHTDAVRVYGGGYYFDGANTDETAGWRTRIAADITPDLQVGARFQRDDERGSQGFIEATVRLPFGHKKSYRKEGLKARLDDAPERDIDIVTAQSVVDPGARVVVENVNTGNAQVVLHVDNTAAGGGDGSAEAPFNTLANAQAAATPHSIIYVHEGDGTAANQDTGITLSQTGQQLLGSGADFFYNTSLFTTRNGLAPHALLIAEATTAPVLSNINVSGDGVTVTADDVRISGIRVIGAQDIGISVVNADGAVIEDVATNNNLGRGIYAQNTDGGTRSITIRDLTTQLNGNVGLQIDTNVASTWNTISLTDIDSSSNGLRGIYVINTGVSVIRNLQMDNITANSNSFGGVLIQNTSSLLDNLSISNATVNLNTGAGIQVTLSGVSSTINSIDLQDVTANQNSSLAGVYIFGIGASNSLGSAHLDNVTANSNINGIWLRFLAARLLSSHIENSQTNNNSNVGLYFFGSSLTHINSSVETHYSTGNAANGVYVDDDAISLTPFNIDLGGGTLGSAGNNRIFGNSGTELRVDLDGGNLMAENNWWGNPAGLLGGEVTLEVGSTVDADPFLAADPGP
jgi:hypothetical protein